ncbi:MAG TPA: hypothetical protein VNU71_20210 [Burkholderiaceae bacterium]|nr:hypothetical protein [Burkholderiaceae bacterium]
MKKLPFAAPLLYRRREPAEGTLAEARRPFRLWMSGSLAVVMAALVPLRGSGEFDRPPATRILRLSPFDVSETLQRIELAARDGGLSVLARVPGMPSALVLASSVGGTLVVMNEADSRPAMPLSVMVREARGGGAEVLVDSLPAEAWRRDWAELPASVRADVQALPLLVERALG